MSGWIGVGFDGTLVTYDGGAPIPPMVDRVRAWLAEGKEVRIFTARIYQDGTEERKIQADQAATDIYDWCLEIFGQPLMITCVKDYAMIELWDDRCVQVEPNTGKRVDDAVGLLQQHNRDLLWRLSDYRALLDSYRHRLGDEVNETSN